MIVVESIIQLIFSLLINKFTSFKIISAARNETWKINIFTLLFITVRIFVMFHTPLKHKLYVHGVITLSYHYECSVCERRWGVAGSWMWIASDLNDYCWFGVGGNYALICSPRCATNIPRKPNRLRPLTQGGMAGRQRPENGAGKAYNARQSMIAYYLN